ncbi:hypothetical protein QMZ05_24615 [Bradyrhizobium sp. INPA03-11B]
MKLPDTNIELHDTSAKPRGDAMKKAKADLNVVGDSPFMKSVRRQA